MIEIKKYREDKRAVWNDFIKTSENGHFMFHRSYMNYHSDRFQDYSLMIYDQGKLKAVLPANHDNKTIHSHQGLTFGGLVCSPRMYTSDTVEILKAICNWLRIQGFHKFIYKCIPVEFHRKPRADDRYALFREGFNLYRSDVSSVIDLSLPLKYRSTKKQNIKKAKEVNIQVRKCTDLGSFWTLLDKILVERHNATATHSLEEMNQLISSHSKEILFYQVESDSEVFGGCIIYKNARSVHTQYLAVSDNGKSLGALDFLLDFLIQDYQKQGVRYFSFGISTEEQGKVLNEGLLFQKEGFGARAIVLEHFELNLAQQK